jgi:hypothetical protein
MGNEQHSLATYVSDMLAVERHIRVPFETQCADNDVQEYSDAAGVVQRLKALTDTHIDALKNELERLGGHEASPIKSAVTLVEGVVAGAIDKVRKTKVSKALRDDYTALSLCTISYSELLATANGMHDDGVAQLAERHLSNYADIVMEISECIPGVVLRELQATGLDVDSSVVNRTRHTISQAWQRTSRPFHEGEAPPTTTGTIEPTVSGDRGISAP